MVMYRIARLPLPDGLGQIGPRPEHLHCIERRGVRDDRLLRLDNLPILQLDADRLVALEQDLGDVRVHLQLAAKLLEPAHERLRDLLGAAHRHAVARAVFEEAIEDVKDVRRHRALGGEAAEYAHRVDPVAQERLRHDLIDRLVQALEYKGEVGQYPRPAHHEGRASGGRREEPSVLPEVHERDGGHRAAQVLQPLAERRPLAQRELRVRRMLAQRRLEPAAALVVVADRESPVALRGTRRAWW